MAIFLRRRLSNNHLSRCLILAISASILILIALISLLASTPIDNNNTHHHHPQHNSVILHDNNEIQDDAADVFRVPIGGRSSGRGDLWGSSLSKFYYGCSDASKMFTNAEVNTVANRYLMITASGGLNQQRTGITDAVVAARILNATLVVPKLDEKSFWKDSSNFSEIFNVDWFISFLSNDVKIIKQLLQKGGKIMSPRRMRVPRKCTPRCYKNRVLPVLLKKHAVHLTKFDYRLANKLDKDLQKLRCRVNYHALKFTDPILEMGKELVRRMRMRSRHFIALHLRFEPDMLAFSGCYYGGGEKERRELGAIRRRWKTLHSNNPDKERRHGRCPLTPGEVGLMLRALGFGSDVHIYVASGEVYGGEETLEPLKVLFPNFHSKDTIASREELAPFSLFSSRMAALDFIVCDESDVFVTNNNGNMARILAGRRRYFGHKRTIRPNAKKLYSLFLNRTQMNWEAFASKVRAHQRGFMGEPNEVRPGRGEFHENPSTCICENSEAKAKKDSGHQSQTKISQQNGSKDTGESNDDQFNDDEPDWPDTDYPENQDGTLEKDLTNVTDLDYDEFQKYEEQPELEELLSD
ncbi:GDP-fucose protein O-fucosyltransferase [Macleaya cordata]|uniref:O-fucosyltransferase family protein n=1 Tax=Macleaya cordata TaxID=56857 RepID=A0A200QYT8_MACCD|nr:GDP-fucose protein O-fucosyltransferase [Macleaya cordata]